MKNLTNRIIEWVSRPLIIVESIGVSIEDRITLGIFAGITANIVRNIVGFISFFAGLQDYHIWQFAASAYVTTEEAQSVGMIVGLFSDYMIASLLGVFAVYFLLYVGFNYYLLKGIFIGGLAWVFIFTIVVSTGISKINPNSTTGSISYLFNHLLLGVLIVIILKKYGKKVYD